MLNNLFRSLGYEIVKYNPPENYIISFPKSGRTWLNLLLGKIFEKHCGMSNLPNDILLRSDVFHQLFKEKIPYTAFSHDGNENFFRKPNELKTNKNKFKNSNIIFLARHPGDVIVSSWYEKTKRIKLGTRNKSYWKPFEGTISDYLKEEKGGLNTVIKFYNIWEKNRSIPKNFLFIKYEDLRADTFPEIRKIVDFIGLSEINDEIIKEAIEYSSFSNMQKIEKEGGTKSDKLKPVDTNDTSTFKTRKGKVGGYKDYFNEEEQEYIHQKIKNELSDYFGY